MTQFELDPEYPVGWSGKKVRIRDGWRVLDVGSGHAPFVRADVLLERSVDDDEERSGAPINIHDRRLVRGDALHMPFRDRAFDYVVASHIAEHVDDPEQFCRELKRVAPMGYIETPGWLGDIIMREPFHRWRVRKRGETLIFTEVANPRPLGWFGDVLYAICYAGRARPDRPSLASSSRLLNAPLTAIRYALAGLFRVPGIRGRMWMRHEWFGVLDCEVLRRNEVVGDAARQPNPAGRTRLDRDHVKEGAP